MNYPNPKGMTKRSEILHRLYEDVHGHSPKDIDDIYIINLLDNLKDAYDYVFEQFKEIGQEKCQKKRKQLIAKENCLWKIGIWAQKHLNIYINDYKVGGYDGTKGKYIKPDRYTVGSRGNSKISNKGLFQGYQES